MHTHTAIRERRAVKHFDPRHVMPEEDIRQLMELAMLSPTGFNIQNWRFVLVRDPELRRQIRAAAWDQAQVTDASLLVILCADKLAWKRRPERYWANAPEAVRKVIVPMIGQFYEGNERAQRDEGRVSCGIAGQTLMLAAKAMGYDSCPMEGFDYAKVGQLINLPDDHLIAFMVAIGKALKPANPRGGQIPYEEAVIIDRFPPIPAAPGRS